MEEETTLYYDADLDPVVSEIRELNESIHQDVSANTLLLDNLNQITYYNVVANLWISSLLAVLIGIGLVLVLKRK